MLPFPAATVVNTVRPLVLPLLRQSSRDSERSQLFVCLLLDMNKASDQLDRRGDDARNQNMSPQTRPRPKRSGSFQDTSEDELFSPTPNDASSTQKPEVALPASQIQGVIDLYPTSNVDAGCKRSVPARRTNERTSYLHGAMAHRPASNKTSSKVAVLALTDEEILEELGKWISKKKTGKEDDHLKICFVSANLFPPVTKKSLSELDIGAIITNAKLRHDVSFDYDLHFRPNFDGEKGKEKMKAAEDYWIALRTELELYHYIFILGELPPRCRGESLRRVASICQRRMPAAFEIIRDILKNLVPEKDQGKVDDQFDVPMLMQQIEKGVCDLVKLACWLEGLLKAHCAPMRDEWIEKMVKKIELAVETSRSDYMVEALRDLLGILEAMKLDVANHQIRHLRMLLIDDTINFEQKFHLQRIARDRINVDASQQWFAGELRKARRMQSGVAKERSHFQFETFASSVLHLLLSNNPRQSFPETFYLDADRLRTLKSELEDLVYFDFCCRVFNDLVRRLGYTKRIPDTKYQALQDTIFTIVKQTGYGSTRQWAANMENVSVELIRQAHRLCGTPYSYDSRLVMFTDDMLRRIFQSPYPPCPDLFALHAERIHRLILPRVLELAERHLFLSPIDMFNSLVVQAVPPIPPPPPPPVSSNSASAPSAALSPSVAEGTPEHIAAPNDQVTLIARRIAHITVLHWRIWHQIVYTRADESKLPSPLTNVETTSPATQLTTATTAESTQAPIRRQGSTSDTALEKTPETQPSEMDAPIPASTTEDKNEAETTSFRGADAGAKAPALER